MNGIHDMGGMHGFGPVEPEPNEPVFHADWERRLFALQLSARAAGIYTADESRAGIESMPPAEYLRASYYERFLFTLEKNLLAKGTLAAEELETRRQHYQAQPAAPLPQRHDPALVARLIDRIKRTGASRQREVAAAPRFQVGDPVRARNVHPHGHTRLPRYARGHRGVIDRVYPAFVLPDTSAQGQGEPAEYLYGVRFESGELWGTSTEPHEAIYLDLWESYLDPA